MEKAIFIRHGKSLVDLSHDELLEEGIEQMCSLTERHIKPLADKEKFYVLCGPSNRTTMSALYIEKTLYPGVYGYVSPIQELDQELVLTPSSARALAQLFIDHPDQNIKRIVEEHGEVMNGIIFVSHHTIIPPLSKYFAQKFGLKNSQNIEEIAEGHAIYHNYKEQKLELWQP